MESPIKTKTLSQIRPFSLEFKQMLSRQMPPLISEGNISYNKDLRALSIIRLKKKIVKEFPELNALKQAFYRAELWNNYNQLKQRINQIIIKKQGVPILLFLFKE